MLQFYNVRVWRLLKISRLLTIKRAQKKKRLWIMNTRVSTALIFRWRVRIILTVIIDVFTYITVQFQYFQPSCTSKVVFIILSIYCIHCVRLCISITAGLCIKCYLIDHGGRSQDLCKGTSSTFYRNAVQYVI